MTDSKLKPIDPQEPKEVPVVDEKEKKRLEKEKRRTKEKEAVQKLVDDAATAHLDLLKKFQAEDEAEKE